MGVKDGKVERFLTPVKIHEDPRSKIMSNAYDGYAKKGLPIVEFHGYASEGQASNSYGMGNLEWARDVTQFVTKVSWTTSTQAPWENMQITMKLPLDAWQTIIPGKTFKYPKMAGKDGSHPIDSGVVKTRVEQGGLDVVNKYSPTKLGADKGWKTHPRRIPETGFWVVLRGPVEPTNGIQDWGNGFPAYAWGYATMVNASIRAGDDPKQPPMASVDITVNSWVWLCQNSRMVMAPAKAAYVRSGFSFGIKEWKDHMSTFLKWASKGNYPGQTFSRMWEGSIPLHVQGKAPLERGDGICQIYLPNTIASTQGFVYRGDFDHKALNKLSGEDQLKAVEKIGKAGKGPNGYHEGSGSNLSHKFMTHMKPYRMDESIPVVWNMTTCGYFAPNRLPQMLRVPGRALNSFGNSMPHSTIWQWFCSTFAADNRVVEIFPSLETPLPHKNPGYRWVKEGNMAMGASVLANNDAVRTVHGTPSGMIRGDTKGTTTTLDHKTANVTEAHGSDPGLGSLNPESPLDPTTQQPKYTKAQWKSIVQLARRKAKLIQDGTRYGLYTEGSKEEWKKYIEENFDDSFVKSWMAESADWDWWNHDGECHEDIIAPGRNYMTPFAKGLGAQPVIMYRMRPKFFIPNTQYEWTKYLRDREKTNTNIPTKTLLSLVISGVTPAEYLSSMMGYYAADAGLRTCSPLSYTEYAASENKSRGALYSWAKSEVMSVNLVWDENTRVNAVYINTPINPGSQMKMFGLMGRPAVGNRDVGMHGLRMYEVDWPYYPIHAGQVAARSDGLVLNMQLTSMIDIAYQMIGSDSQSWFHAGASVLCEYRPLVKAGHWCEIALPSSGTFVGATIPQSALADTYDQHLPDSSGGPRSFSAAHAWDREAFTGYITSVTHEVQVHPDGKVVARTSLNLQDVTLGGRGNFQVAVPIDRKWGLGSKEFIITKSGSVLFGEFDAEKHVFVSTDDQGNKIITDVEGNPVGKDAVPGSTDLGGEEVKVGD